MAKKKKYVMEDSSGFRVPEWLFDRKVRMAAYKVGVLKRILLGEKKNNLKGG
ncbi:unnamed protein product [marine sediment metagenome]|uniref:Uncharacterized protein n=1 Tax=marine sediment metagenome TaxID=412755 RepID=X0TF29_9ZZZZ